MAAEVQKAERGQVGAADVFVRPWLGRMAYHPPGFLFVVMPVDPYPTVDWRVSYV